MRLLNKQYDIGIHIQDLVRYVERHKRHKHRMRYYLDNPHKLILLACQRNPNAAMLPALSRIAHDKIKATLDS